MSKLNELVVKGQVKLMQARNKVQDKLVEMSKTKLSGDSQLVVALVLIAVAVGLCFIFRNTINQVMNQLFTAIKGAISNLSAGMIQN